MSETFACLAKGYDKHVPDLAVWFAPEEHAGTLGFGKAAARVACRYPDGSALPARSVCFDLEPDLCASRLVLEITLDSHGLELPDCYEWVPCPRPFLVRDSASIVHLAACALHCGTEGFWFEFRTEPEHGVRRTELFQWANVPQGVLL